jgi:hypothetical protein
MKLHRVADYDELSFLPQSGALGALTTPLKHPYVVFTFCRYNFSVAVSNRLFRDSMSIKLNYLMSLYSLKLVPQDYTLNIEHNQRMCVKLTSKYIEWSNNHFLWTYCSFSSF